MLGGAVPDQGRAPSSPGFSLIWVGRSAKKLGRRASSPGEGCRLPWGGRAPLPDSSDKKRNLSPPPSSCWRRRLDFSDRYPFDASVKYLSALKTSQSRTLTAGGACAQSYAEYLKDWRHLGQLAADAALAGTSAARRQATLATLVAKIDELLQQQSERNAAKQVASEEIRVLILQGRELARDIKLEIKGSLGARAIELVKYKLNPLREGQRSKKAKPAAASKRAANGGQPPGGSPSRSPARPRTPRRARARPRRLAAGPHPQSAVESRK